MISYISYVYIYIYIWKTGEIKLRISQLVHRYYCMSCICVYTYIYIYIYIHIYIYIVWYHDVSLCVIMCHCYHIGWETMTISVRNICLIKLCHISPGANGDVFFLVTPFGATSPSPVLLEASPTLRLAPGELKELPTTFIRTLGKNLHGTSRQ